jgi:Resolvase, N terminal domain
MQPARVTALRAASQLQADRVIDDQRGRGVIRGYARSLQGGQTVPTQVNRLWAAGAQKVYSEVRGSRVELAYMFAELKFRDIVVVTRLDHLAEAPEDLINILAAITERGVRFHSLRWAERHRSGLLPGFIDLKQP